MKLSTGINCQNRNSSDDPKLARWVIFIPRNPRVSPYRIQPFNLLNIFFLIIENMSILAEKNLAIDRARDAPVSVSD